MEDAADQDFASRSATSHNPERADLTDDELHALRPADEGRKIIELEESFWQNEAVSGATCYALDYEWWQRWCKYTGVVVRDRQSASIEEVEDESERKPRPGPINNYALLSTIPSSSLREGSEYTFKSPATWKLFQRLYPISGPEISRPVLAGGRTDLHPIQVCVHRSSELPASRGKTVYVQKDGTCKDLKVAACHAFGLSGNGDDVRMFDWYQKRKYTSTPMEDSQTLDSSKIIEDQDILMEEKVDGKFPETEDSSASSLFSTARPFISRPTLHLPEDTATMVVNAAPGIAGLSNLGNTCFMNSSVQCLSHSLPLVQVFLSGAYKADINRDNPLGNKGQLAEAFGALMEKLWQGNVGSVAPRRFKQQIASFAPHFAGYQQHDSQELLAFLLDGLHEDLNRVKNKPYIEEPDSDGRPDEEVAAEAWRNYKARNNSFIADHFQGMYKSTLVCPDCGFHSVKMDSFNCLSLPLPAAKMRTIEVTVVTMDGSAPPTQYALEVLKLGVIGDLYRALADVCGVKEADLATMLLLVEVWNGRVHTKFTDMKEPLADGIRSSTVTLLAYKYPSREAGPASGNKELHVFQRRVRNRTSYYFNDCYEVFAAPLILWLPEARIKVAAGAQDSSVEALFTPHGPLTQAVETALRPFKRQRVESDQPGAPPGATALQLLGPAAGEEVEMEPLLSEAALPARADACAAGIGGAAPVRKPQSTAPSSETDLSSEDADQGAGEQTPDNLPEAPGAHVSGALSISPRDTPNFSPNTSPVGSPPRENNSGESSSFQPSAERPFNMFARQHEAAAASQREAAGDTSEAVDTLDSCPYSIHLATPYGQPSTSQLSLEDGQLFFAIDWAADAAEHYEPERIEQPHLHPSVEAAKARHAAGPKPYTLDECVEAFLEGERLEDSESWFCKRCKKLVQADKKLDLWSLPEVLVVHLKRFSYSHRFRDKIDVLVKFPLAGLDLSGATLRSQEVEPVYDLFAVSNHFGGLGAGHYTALCKLNEDGKWYTFDDSSTYEVSADRVMSEAAYVLFYRRRVEARQDAGKSIGELLGDKYSPATTVGAASADGRQCECAGGQANVDEAMLEQASGPSSPALQVASPRKGNWDGIVLDPLANGMLSGMEWQYHTSV